MTDPLASDLLDLLKRICAHLVRPSVTAAEMASLLGRVEADEECSPILVAPADPALESASVSREWDSDEPSDVELFLSPQAALPVAALRQAFGSYAHVPMLPSGGLPSIHFEIDLGSATHTCALFASVQTGEGLGDEGLVRHLILRRDIRLD